MLSLQDAAPVECAPSAEHTVWQLTLLQSLDVSQAVVVGLL
jgi:hypothetical protein